MQELKLLYDKYLSFKDNEKISFNKLKNFTIPRTRGCYIILDKNGKVVYVGRTIRLKDRFDTHHRKKSGMSTFRRKLVKKFNFKTEEETTQWIEENYSLSYIEINDQSEERRFEHFLIALLNPELND